MSTIDQLTALEILDSRGQSDGAGDLPVAKRRNWDGIRGIRCFDRFRP
ncbi:MAG: hypothetical protein R2845_07665 [Thermomicrobiales bacterium]